MLAEALEHLALADGRIIVDCTLGGGSHSRAIADGIAPTGILIGIDQDDAALSAARDRLGSAPLDTDPILVKGNFGDLDGILVELGVLGVDGFLFDLGVSSPQLDFPERGFSYNEDAPLDMRMNPGSHTTTAAEVIRSYSEADLARVFRDFGEERWANRIASFVVTRRATEPILTTFDLVDVVKAAIPAAARREGGHPARRVFQALRIEVNRELDVLRAGLESAVKWLSPGGRVVVISYHSLEDRIVKQLFARESTACTCPPGMPICTCGAQPTLRVITRKALAPNAGEIERNPRARSAKMRVAEKV